MTNISPSLLGRCVMSAGLLAIILLSGRAHGGLKEGLEATAANDYERTYREMMPLAEAGNPMAQTAIAHLFAIGKVVPKDDAKAVQWYLRAAEGGSIPAQINLAAKYRLGRGVKVDYETALKWYRRAADQRDEDGYLGLTDMYERGQGVRSDPVAAFGWLKKAAETDYPLAQYELGLHYWQGRGVRRNDDEAFAWFQKAANQKYEPAMVSLGMMHFGDGRPVNTAEGCFWLMLAQRSGGVRKEDVKGLETTVKQRCGAISQAMIEERISKWKPQEIWYQRKQQEFADLLKKAQEDDERRRKVSDRK